MQCKMQIDSIFWRIGLAKNEEEFIRKLCGMKDLACWRWKNVWQKNLHRLRDAEQS